MAEKPPLQDHAERVRALGLKFIDALLEVAAAPIGPPEPEPVYSLKQIAQMLTLSRSEVQRLRQRGLLESIQIGRRHVVTASQFRRFLERQENGR